MTDVYLRTTMTATIYRLKSVVLLHAQRDITPMKILSPTLLIQMHGGRRYLDRHDNVVSGLSGPINLANRATNLAAGAQIRAAGAGPRRAPAHFKP